MKGLQYLKQHTGLPGAFGPQHHSNVDKQGNPTTNKWVQDHLAAVLEMTPEEVASKDAWTRDEIAARLKALGGTDQPLEVRLFISPVAERSGGTPLVGQRVVMSRVGLTHAPELSLRTGPSIENCSAALWGTSRTSLTKKSVHISLEKC